MSNVERITPPISSIEEDMVTDESNTSPASTEENTMQTNTPPDSIQEDTLYVVECIKHNETSIEMNLNNV